MNSSYIITFIADDRPGLVEQLSTAIKQHGGNWWESRLSQLGGKFAGLILVSLPTENSDALKHALGDLDPGCISVTVTAIAGRKQQTTDSHIRLSIIGPDRPGIVQEIARVLAGEYINVIELESSVSSAPMSAELIFSGRLLASVSKDTELVGLRETLDTIAEQMTLEIDLEQVE
ncbi:MAG: hypothetical protein HRT77_14340 [Halioglobus sp.]|nr:hypothetical protein [Halioglobus sp.]